MFAQEGVFYIYVRIDVKASGYLNLYFLYRKLINIYFIYWFIVKNLIIIY